MGAKDGSSQRAAGGRGGRVPAALERHSWLWRGYTQADVRGGIQFACGWGLVLGVYAVPAVWNRLSELGANITIVLILYGVFATQGPGGCALGMILIALILGLVAGLVWVPTSLAYAAGGGSGGGGSEAAQAIVMVLLVSVLTGLLAVARMRFEALDMPLYAACYGVSAVSVGFYWGLGPTGLAALPRLNSEMAYLMAMASAVAFCAALPVAFLVVPLPAGRKIRRLTCDSLQRIGRLSEGVVQLAAGGELAAGCGGGKPGAGCRSSMDEKYADGGSESEGRSGKSDSGSEAQPELSAEAELVARLQQELVGLQDALSKLPLLLLSVRGEVDVYARQKRLPAQAYSRLAACAGTCATSLGLMLRPLARAAAPAHGSLGLDLVPPLPLDLSACQAVAPQLRSVAATLAGCCEALAAVLGRNAPFEEALSQLRGLEDSWGALAAETVRFGGVSRAAVLLRMLVGLLRTLGLQVEDMYPAAAAAVEPLQRGAVALAAEHTRTSLIAKVMAQLLPPPEEGTAVSAALQAAVDKGAANGSAAVAGGAGAAGAGAVAAPAGGDNAAAEADPALPQGPAAVVVELPADASSPPAASGGSDGGAAAAPSTPPKAAAAAAAAHELPAIDHPSAEAAARAAASPWLSLLDRLDRAGLGGPQLRPGLHMGLAIASAATLVVVRPVFVAFAYKTNWVLYTVNAVFERCVGNVLSRGVNRAIGTGLGVCWSLFAIAMTYLANGSSYVNSAAKYATMACLVTLWSLFVGMNRNRHPKHAYSWVVMSSTVAIVALEGFREEEAPWKNAGFRAACVCIGITLDALITAFVFPVTADAIMRQKLRAGLAGLASLAEQVAAVHSVQASGAAVDSRAAKRLAATEKKVRKAALKMAALRGSVRLEEQAHFWPAGPSGSTAGSDGSALSRAALDATRDYMLQICDLLSAVAHVRLSLPAARLCPLSPRALALVEASATQMTECFLALRLVLSGALSMPRALRTLGALDALLRMLAAETAAALQKEDEEYRRQWCSAGSNGATAAGKGGDAGNVAEQARLPGHPIKHFRARPAMAFVAAGLGTSRVLRRLYHASAMAFLADEAAAVQAAEAVLRAAAADPLNASVADAEQAALAAAFSQPEEGEVQQQQQQQQ